MAELAFVACRGRQLRMRRRDLIVWNCNSIPNGALQGRSGLGLAVQQHVGMLFKERRHRILALAFLGS